MMSENLHSPLAIYVCPACKGDLDLGEDRLFCERCRVGYSIRNGIPDFILDDLGESASPILRGHGTIDKLAQVYESAFWYPLVIGVFAGMGATNLREIRHKVAEFIDISRGAILDVACGPGTLGRQLAGPGRNVFGVDISWGMLRKGMDYGLREGLRSVHFARSRGENLPFRDSSFEAAICGGALHLFPDTLSALKEFARTMKPGAPLAVTTFVAGGRGILRFTRIREHVTKEHGARIFDMGELERELEQAGFVAFKPWVRGSFLVFRARRS